MAQKSIHKIEFRADIGVVKLAEILLVNGHRLLPLCLELPTDLRHRCDINQLPE